MANEMLKEITGHEQGKRRKRRVFHFIGKLSKVIFGTMDEDNSKNCNKQVELFQQNSEDMMIILK